MVIVPIYCISNSVSMYKIYTDKKEEFTCQLEIEGTETSNTDSRLILETDKGFSLLFPGKVSESGKCTVSIDKIKHVLKENDAGTIKLEVIADDTMFVPWESNFVVKVSKKVSLSESSNLASSKPSKPSVKAVVVESSEPEKAPTNTSLTKHVNAIVKIVESFSASKKKFNLNTVFELYKEQAQLTPQQFTDLKKVFLN